MKTDTQDRKLSTTKKANSKKADMFFWAVWGVSALTTFQFGMLYVSALFVPLFAMLPLTDYAQWLFSSICGGLSALLVLDIAYKYWSFIKLECCETSEQFAAAASAKSLSFGLSLAYTAIALFTTAFSHLVSAEMLNWLDWFGAGSFVGVCVYHLICWNTYADNAPDVRTMETLTKTAGLQLSENLNFKETVIEAALKEATEQAEEYKMLIAKQLGAQWGQQMVAEFAGGFVELAPTNAIDGELIPSSAELPPSSPVTSPIGFGAKAQQPVDTIEQPVGYDKVCAVCGQGFTAQRRNARYCGNACKQSAQYQRKNS